MLSHSHLENSNAHKEVEMSSIFITKSSLVWETPACDPLLKPGLAFARNASSVKENQIREPGQGFIAMPGCPGGGRGVTDKWLRQGGTALELRLVLTFLNDYIFNGYISIYNNSFNFASWTTKPKIVTIWLFSDFLPIPALNNC